MKKILLLICFSFTQICFATYYSQCKQDKFVNEHFFKNKKNGFFVDIGAHNGVTYSNTFFFEKELNWTGICIEPIPKIFNELKSNRNCLCVQGCISDFNGISQLLNVSNPIEGTKMLSMLSGLLHKYNHRHINRIK